MLDIEQTGEGGGSDASSDLRARLPMHCNTADRELFAQVQAAVNRNLPILQRIPEHDGIALLVGGGPSLADTLQEIRARYESGAHIFALNGAGMWLIEHGIIPYAQVVLDARESNERFLRVCHDATKFYLASQCHPALFDRLTGHNVTMWHANYDGESGVVENRDTVLIGGGTVVGLHAMHLCHVLGYRTLHLYGYDSSYRDAEGHAYAQPENGGERVIPCTVGGQTFYGAPWMIRQAGDFQDLAVALADLGSTIYTHGDGLLPAVARDMMRRRPVDAACYDLAFAPASWDFLNWLVLAEMEKRKRGVTAPLRVGFKPGPNGGFRDDQLPWNPKQRQHFLDTVMRPALEMFGAIEDPAAADGNTNEYLFRGICAASREGEEVPRFEPPMAECQFIDAEFEALGISRPVVITLREAAHWSHRNSNCEAWFAFAEKLKTQGIPVIFVRDTEKADEPLSANFMVEKAASTSVFVRAALYSRARCNLFVANGPAALCLFGTAPFLMFKPLIEGWCAGTPEWWETRVGVNEGEQFPWSAPNQRIVWAPDTLETIEAAWASWQQDNP
jgi:hypothetical protein